MVAGTIGTERDGIAKRGRLLGVIGPGLPWTIALMGGVGGTLTVLCYGYWIREKGRTDASALRTCRIDLGVGYAATALFGTAMAIIGSTIQVQGKEAGLVVALTDRLQEPRGPVSFITGI